MKSITKAQVTVKALRARLAAQGYQPGLPEHITAQTVAIDRQLVQRSRCQGCKKRGRLSFNPFRHASEPRYKIVAVCGECGHSTEF